MFPAHWPLTAHVLGTGFLRVVLPTLCMVRDFYGMRGRKKSAHEALAACLGSNCWIKRVGRSRHRSIAGVIKWFSPCVGCRWDMVTTPVIGVWVLDT